MTLLEIYPKSRKGSYVWEHALKTAMGTLGTFGGVLFLIMFSGGKRGGNSKAAGDMIVYLFSEHNEILILICFIAALLLNAKAYSKNKQKRYITKIVWDEQKSELTFGMISVYSDDQIEKKLHINDTFFYESYEKEFLIGKHKIIQFADRRHNEFGILDPSYEIHKKFVPQVKRAISLLNELKELNSQTKNGTNG